MQERNKTRDKINEETCRTKETKMRQKKKTKAQIEEETSSGDFPSIDSCNMGQTFKNPENEDVCQHPVYNAGSSSCYDVMGLLGFGSLCEIET